MMRTLIIVILEESRDIGTEKARVLEGFNSFIDDQKKIKNDIARLYLVKFNTVVTVINKAIPLENLPELTNQHKWQLPGEKFAIYDPIADYFINTVIRKDIPQENVPELTNQNYFSGRETALFDAIAEGVRIAEKDKTEDERVICLIITDNKESSSGETTKEQIRNIISVYEAKGDWTFLYIGDNPDQWARNAGLSAAHGISYNHKEPQLSYMEASLAVSKFRQSLSKQGTNLFNKNIVEMVLNPNYEQIGKAFVKLYYATMDDPSQRPNVANFYSEQKSLMSFEGKQMMGRTKIMEKIQSLTFRRIQRIITAIDAQPTFDGGVLVTVMGQLKTDDDPIHNFNQVFVLKQVNDSFYVEHDCFRL